MMVSETISCKDSEILAIFGKLLPKMTNEQRERLLAFGNGMSVMLDRQAETVA